ncbi:MAG: ribosome maturation factor RimM [Acidobacteriota bacterium]|nr:ribosome maturation factor RimM [Acidobacteriota bacterium]
MDTEKVVLAEILRTRGIRGEVIARSQTDIPERLENLREVNAKLADGSSVRVEIASAWRHKGDWVLKFSGTDSIEAAQRFCGADLWVPLAHRGRLPEGDFFQADLIGCRLIDRTTEDCIGVVEGWQTYGGAPLMEVSADGRERLIPFVSSLCQVDLVARTVKVELPEGLLDL